MKNEKIKMLRLTEDTHKRLQKICKKEETYDKLINNLIDLYEKVNNKK